MGVFAELGEQFEEVVFFHDHPSQLRGIVAIHSTALGPAHQGISTSRAADRFALERVDRLGRLRQTWVPRR